MKTLGLSIRSWRTSLFGLAAALVYLSEVEEITVQTCLYAAAMVVYGLVQRDAKVSSQDEHIRPGS